MAAKIDIINGALQNLGEEQAKDPNELSQQAKVINFRYDVARKELLELHPWNFALKRAALANTGTAPLFQFTNAFRLPSDLIRMVATDLQLDLKVFGNPDFNGFQIISNFSTFQEADRYSIENDGIGKLLLSDDESKEILYVYDQQDPEQFSPTFTELLSKSLSAKCAYRITNSRTVAEAEREEFLLMLDNALSTDSQQGTTERIEVSSFLSARN